MAVRQINVGAIEVFGIPGLDVVDVYWKDVSPGRGSVTIACYGQAWTAHFNAMSSQTIGEFFVRADTSYLVNKLSVSNLAARFEKREAAYLTRIVDAIKDALAA